MVQKFKGSKSNLGEPLATQLADFLTANYKGQATEFIREAVAEHLKRRLENPEMKERYEKARKERLGIADQVVQLITKTNGD